MATSKFVRRAMLISVIVICLVSVAVSAPATHSDSDNIGFVGLERHEPARHGNLRNNSTAPSRGHPFYCCCAVCCMTKKCTGLNMTNSSDGLTSDYLRTYELGEYSSSLKGPSIPPSKSIASNASFSSKLFLAILIALSVIIILNS
ncbi:hypothetical protein F5Y19DRAFT_486721 [Xylariaceae sp. FL1651]|nr:hypothetical protein F5Y19DRAFT_486721 [Xylariaceae sp. FL1651]